MRVYLGIILGSIIVVGQVLSARVGTKLDLCVVRDDKLTINVSLDDLVGPFRAKIERIWKVPAAKQRLVFGNNFTDLSDDYSSFAEQGYKGDCNINMIIVEPNRKEAAQSNYKPVSVSAAQPVVVEHRASLDLSLSLTDTVGSFKKMIQQHWYLPVEAQKLTRGPEKTPMDDNSRTLAYYNVTDLDYFDVSYAVHEYPKLFSVPSQ